MQRFPALFYQAPLDLEALDAAIEMDRFCRNLAFDRERILTISWTLAIALAAPVNDCYWGSVPSMLYYRVAQRLNEVNFTLAEDLHAWALSKADAVHRIAYGSASSDDLVAAIEFLHALHRECMASQSLTIRLLAA